MLLRKGVLLLLILVLYACPGCGTGKKIPEITVTTESSATLAMPDKPEKEQILSERYRITTLGKIEGNPSSLPEKPNAVSAEALPDTVPVFVDPYPFNQEGAMFEVDDAYRQKSAATIEQYMKLLFGNDFTLNPNAIEETEQRSHYSFGGYTVSGDPTGISLSCEADVSSAESLMKSPAVSAMLSYCGIRNPRVRTSVSAFGETTECRYIITEEYDDAFQNGTESSFTFVEVTGRIGEETAWVSGTVIDHSEVYAVGTTISPEAAAADLQSRLAGRAGEYEIAAYEMTYRNDVDYGYFIPCYVFYVRQAGRADYDLYFYRMCLTDKGET